MWRDGWLLASSGVVFLVSATASVLWCRSMAGGMPMPGRWTMSMAWMRMPGQSWPQAAGMFIAMWTLMMVPMMLPCLVPMLLHYRRVLESRGVADLTWPTTQAAAGYVIFWAFFGVLAYPFGAVLATTEMRSEVLSRYVPLATGIVIVIAGTFQLTSWKARRLVRCRQDPACGNATAAPWHNPFLQGLRLGTDCGECCLGFMIVLLLAGVMDLKIMAIVTIGITFERIVPRPVLAARIAGAIIVPAGAALILQAIQ
jgi:predicted metal-binding membrane protein